MIPSQRVIVQAREVKSDDDMREPYQLLTLLGEAD